MINYRKIENICCQLGGYASSGNFNVNQATPSDVYDPRINQIISFDKNGIVNLKKISDESRIDDSSKLKLIQIELHNFKKRYESLQVNIK